jgi:hypothetical protein
MTIKKAAWLLPNNDPPAHVVDTAGGSNLDV